MGLVETPGRLPARADGRRATPVMASTRAAKRHSGLEARPQPARYRATRNFQNANMVMRSNSQPCRHRLMFVVPYVRGW